MPPIDRLKRAAFALLLLAAGCGEAGLKAAGAQCFGSAECQAGLICDLALATPVCASQGSGVNPADASVAGDAAPGAADAAPGAADAEPLPDADPPDAAPPV